MSEQPRTIPNLNRGSILGAIVMWAFAAFWNGFLAFFFVVLLRASGGPPRGVVFAMLSPFVLAGIFVAGLALSVTSTLIRYRSLVLRLDTLPGVVGGRVAGRLEGTDAALRAVASLRLACWRRYDSDTSDDLLWEDVEDLQPGSLFRFDVPYECEPTGTDGSRIEWQVNALTHRGGVAGSFTVPVFRTATSSPAITEESLRPRSVSQPRSSALRLEHGADGAVKVRFPRPSWVWKWWLFTLAVAVGGAFAARELLVPELGTGAYAALAAVVLGLVAIIQLGLLFSPRLLRADRDGLRMHFRSILRRPKTMRAADIADFVIKPDRLHKYDVNVRRTRGGTDPWLMMTAVDKREAEWLAHELRAAVGKGSV